MKYVDVILPLPLPGLFTYSVPEGMEGRVVFGKRLLVPLGRSKKYIGMAVKTHDEKPAFEVKPIEQVLDETLCFWKGNTGSGRGSAIITCLHWVMSIMLLSRLD